MQIKRDLRQRDIDAYFPLLRGIPVAELSAPEYAGQIVRAAAKAGLVSGLTPEEVDDLVPGEVVKLSKKINEAVAEALTIPPD
jgi:hypothetical protein